MFMTTGGSEREPSEHENGNEDLHEDSGYKYNDTWTKNAPSSYSSDKSVGDEDVSEHIESHDQEDTVDLCTTEVVEDNADEETRT